MKALKISFILLIFTFVAFQQACDIVKEPYIVSVDTIPTGGGDTTTNIRKVLLEDYTGHKCPNCPEAAVEAHHLKIVYGDSLILLTVHAGFFSTPSPTGDFTYDFRTPEGNELNNFFGFFSYPSGMVNRKEYEGLVVLGQDKWDGAIQDIIRTPQQARITFTNTFNYDTRKLDVKVESEFLENLDGVYNICVFIAESDIIKPQMSDTGVISDYKHNHVLRTSMNGSWGDLVGIDGAAVMGEVNENIYSMIFDPEWIPDHCVVIAFIYNTDTKEVVQAQEAHVHTE